MFGFQAALCYLPKFIWNSTEGGLMGAIASGLNIELYKEDDISIRKRAVIDYIVTHIRVSIFTLNFQFSGLRY